MISIDLIALLIAALAGFVIAAEIVAKGIQKLEPLMGQGMAGGVVLGLLGALPETVFVIVAVLHNSYQVALGSALGGNIILFTLGLGIVGISYTLRWKKEIKMKGDYKVESAFLLSATAALILLLIYGKLDLISGSLLFLIYIVYIVYRYLDAHAMLSKNVKTKAGKKIAVQGVLYILVGALIVIALSQFFVHLILELSSQLLLPAIWVALVISPLAAELQENLGAYRVASKSHGGGSTAIVSFIGGKLQNNTMLVGIIGILAAAPIALSSAAPAIIAVIAVNLIALFSIKRGKLTLATSAVLLLLYFAAIGFVLVA